MLTSLDLLAIGQVQITIFFVQWYTPNDMMSMDEMYEMIVYLILILCNFNLKPSKSESTPDSADKSTTLVIVYK